ncbi:hypothetical protein HOY80DRAFT_1102935 [Tuber brumale]|nr:hypothetical protein HOY80DRAFT_1102935 [Tuber brumale]
MHVLGLCMAFLFNWSGLALRGWKQCYLLNTMQCALGTRKGICRSLLERDHQVVNLGGKIPYAQQGSSRSQILDQAGSPSGEPSTGSKNSNKWGNPPGPSY